ncbi:MAG: GTP 3',8-cyclase MoaA [Desulfomonilia bacterium]|jgi:cyclic pyranopterin phosphate synthase
MKPLIDTHQRVIRYVRISLTDRCNLRCRYCMPPTGVEWIPHENIMRYEEFLRILRICVSRGVDKVRLTGGEPLLRKNLIPFIHSISELGGIKDISLTTNGAMLSSMARDLKEAGLNRLNISLDTLNRKKFAYITRVDAFDRVIQGIQSAFEAGLKPVKLNVVAIRGFNDDEIPEFAKMTLDSPVEVRFIELMPMGCAARYGECELISAPEIRNVIEERFGTMERLEYKNGPAQVYRIGGAQGTIGLIGALSEHAFCGRCNRIRITASGFIRPCLFSEEELDLITPMRRGISDEELEALIEEGVRMKRISHGLCAGTSLASGQGCPSLMSALGG